MPQALIKINGVAGSDDDLPINTLVNLDNQNTGGETTFNWAILDQPPGAVDNLSSSVIQNPTLTPKKEGTYLLELVVNLGQASEQRNRAIAAIRQIKNPGMRVPAAGETVEDDSIDGWAKSQNTMWRGLDSQRSDPNLIVGTAGVGGLVRGDVLRATGTFTLKAGLPGAEDVASFTKALATVATDLDELLVVLEGGVDGNPAPALNAPVRVRPFGLFIGAVGVPGAVGDPVYVSDLGALALAPGANVRRVGSVASFGGGLYNAWLSG